MTIVRNPTWAPRGQEHAAKRSVIGSKRCPNCRRRGEWPSQPCPVCRGDVTAADWPEPDPEPVRPVEQAALEAAGVDPSADASLAAKADVARQRGRGTLAILNDKRRLVELAAIANDEHVAIGKRGMELVEHAIRAGHALLEARRRCHTGWIDWMERHLNMHPTTAYRYMRLAEHEHQVRESAAESIEAAMGALADVPRRSVGPRRYTEADKADWVALVDQLGVKRTAKLLGVSPSTISVWAGPNSPRRGQTRARATGHPSISPEAIERLATWLIKRFGGYEYAERVTDAVRADALDALETALAIKEPDDA